MQLPFTREPFFDLFVAYNEALWPVVVHGAQAARSPVTDDDRLHATDSSAQTSQYGGKTYYFCSKGCKTKFDANPTQYVK